MAYTNNQLKNDHYIYLLRDSNGVVKYIGEGRLERWKSKSGRTARYLEILKSGGTVEIVCRNLTKSEAHQIEKEYIEVYKNTVINRISQNSVKSVIFENFKDVFIIDSTSPTGLSWKTKIRNVKSTIAGSKDDAGYYCVSYRSVSYKVHRIVWCLHNQTNLSNSLVVHHVDGNRCNNAPSNLQAVSQLENINRKVNITKDRRLLGISIHSKRGKSNARLVITFIQNDQRFTKEFSLFKYTYDIALAMALEWKDAKIKEFKNV